MIFSLFLLKYPWHIVTAKHEHEPRFLQGPTALRSEKYFPLAIFWTVYIGLGWRYGYGVLAQCKTRQIISYTKRLKTDAANDFINVSSFLDSYYLAFLLPKHGE